MTELINNLKNIFTGISSYQILEGTVLPIALFFLGIFIEHKYQVTSRITKILNLNLKQSGVGNTQVTSRQESGRDSIITSSPTSIKGPLIGQQNIYPSATPSVAQVEDALKPPSPLEDLHYEGTNADFIIDCFEKHSMKFKIPSTFKSQFITVRSNLNTYKNADVSSAGYFNTFKDIIENLVNEEMYCEREGVGLAVANVSNDFDKLEKLMSKPNKKLNELEALIEAFERNLVTLLAYI